MTARLVALASGSGTNLQAVREGNWKLHLPRSAKDQPFWNKRPNPKRPLVTLDRALLYNLKTDLAEKDDVAAQNPEVVRRLQEQAAAIRKDLGDVRTEGADQRPIQLANPQERPPAKRQRQP